MKKQFIPRLETQMSDKLSRLLPGHKVKSQQRGDSRSPMQAPTGKDGEDHINIWDRATTPMGKLLANRTELKFTHEIFGNFSNVEAFWYYIRSEERDDRIRVMTGEAVRRFAGKLHTVRVPNFKAIIMDTNWQKITQYPDLAQSIKESELPFECYYYYKRNGGVRIRPSFAFWLIKGFDEIRAALKEDRAPNFDFLKDDKKIGIYDAVYKPSEEENGGQQKKKQKKADKQEAPASSSDAQLGALLQSAETAAVAPEVVSAASIDVAEIAAETQITEPVIVGEVSSSIGETNVNIVPVETAQAAAFSPS